MSAESRLRDLKVTRESNAAARAIVAQVEQETEKTLSLQLSMNIVRVIAAAINLAAK